MLNSATCPQISSACLRSPGLRCPDEPLAVASAGCLPSSSRVSAEPPARPALAERLGSLAVQLVALAAGTLLLLVRISGRPAWDGINTEDVDVFLAQALAHPWHLQSYGGYLELVPRLIGQIVSLLPIRYAAAGFAVSGALIASGCGLLAYHASAPLISARWLRVLLGLSVLLLPVAQLEIADNGVNTPFYLLVALFWAVLWRPRSWAGASVAAVVAFATVASSPLALLFAPLLAARAIVVPHRIRENAVTVGWAIGCLLQAPFILASHVSRTAHAAPANSVTYLTRDVIRPALGWHLAWQLRAAFGPDGATLIVGVLLAVILGLAVATQARQCRVFVVTAVATGLVFTFVAATLSWLPSQRVTLGMEPGARYSTLPILLIDAAVIVSADACARRWGPRTWTAVRGGRAGRGAGSRLGQRLPLPGQPQQGNRMGADREHMAAPLPAGPGQVDHCGVGRLVWQGPRDHVQLLEPASLTPRSGLRAPADEPVGGRIRLGVEEPAEDLTEHRLLRGRAKKQRG